MQLRNRLTPRSVTSIPAILSSDTSYISDIFGYRGDEWSEDESYDDEDKKSVEGELVSISEGPPCGPECQSLPSATGPSVELGETIGLSPIMGIGKESHTMMTTRRDVTGPTPPNIRGVARSLSFSPSPPGSSPPSMAVQAPYGLKSPTRAASTSPTINSPRTVVGHKGLRAKGEDIVPERGLPSGPLLPKSLDKLSPRERLKGWVKKTLSPIKDKVSELSKTLRKEESAVELEEFSTPAPLPPRSIVYQSPEKPKPKRKGVRFDAGPFLKERVTRYGRRTKVPSRYLE